MAKANVNALLAQLGNAETPLAQRSSQLIDVLAGVQQGKSGYAPIVEEVFRRLQERDLDEQAHKRAKFLKDLLDQMEGAPMRPATFIRTEELTSDVAPHLLVSLDNGDMAYVLCPDMGAASRLKMGDRVLLDKNGTMMLHSGLGGLYCGPEAKLERKIDECHVEVTNHQDERCVSLASPALIESIDSGKVAPGSAVVLGAGGRLCVKALPETDRVHFKFLDRGEVPDVLVERDIGSPPEVIGRVAKHVREEMTRPELRRRYRLRPCLTCLLAGVSGTGKTLAVQAIHREVYSIMEEVTETPLEELPPRVFKFKTSKMLSMWLGESDKNIDRIFDEVEQLVEQPFVNKRGKNFRLPVMVVMEEADGMGRSRGSDHEGVYDRILTTLLQRLDPNRGGLADKLVVFLSTTNEPNIIDPAFLRRIGGTVERFGRVTRGSFRPIIEKHVRDLPAHKKWPDILEEIEHKLFEPAIDPGVVQLSLQGQSEPMVKYRRDFLTGALIDRAVQEASTKAWEESLADSPNAGLTAASLLSSLNHQVLAVAHQLCPQNITRYLDLPEGARVTGVRRVQTKPAAK